MDLSKIMVSDFNPRKRTDIIIKELAGNPEIEFYHIGPTQGWVGIRDNVMDSNQISSSYDYII